MRWESSGVVGFDLGPLLEGQMRIAKLKSAYNSLIISPRGFGALSLRWIQFALVLRWARSSFFWQYLATIVVMATLFLFLLPICNYFCGSFFAFHTPEQIGAD